MCTVTWRVDTRGYELFHNRDELRTRLPAEPPEVRTSGGRRFIAPADGDFGGSWISVNEAGVTLALLNGFAPADRRTDRDYVSRGKLVSELAVAGSVAEVEHRVCLGELGPYRSFRLLALDPRRGLAVNWKDEELTTSALDEANLPIVSSSFQTDAVVRSRSEQFSALAPDGDRLGTEDHLRFHSDHLPERGPHSVCMHRPDAHTVSFCWIRVDTRSVRFLYTPHAPHAGVNRTDAVLLNRVIQ